MDSSDDEYPKFPEFRLPPSRKERCGFEWSVWRRQFELVAQLRNLDDGDAKSHAMISMKGEAASRILDIGTGPNDGPDMVTLAMYLDRLEARFSPAPGSERAKIEFENETQEIQRGDANDKIGDLQIYKNRLDYFWKRAFPNRDEDHPELRNKFIRGLADARVRESVQDQNPSTITEALNLAQHVTANIEIMRMNRV